ncbi:MAG TPA: hypothetical protein VGH99_22775 [Pseudonocardia sp.]|jgi:hypothetical protein
MSTRVPQTSPAPLSTSVPVAPQQWTSSPTRPSGRSTDRRSTLPFRLGAVGLLLGIMVAATAAPWSGVAIVAVTLAAVGVAVDSARRAVQRAEAMARCRSHHPVNRRRYATTH